MTSFVLVHGSGQNARSWSRVADLLRDAGHAVSAPELPKRPPGWKLGDYAACIAGHVEGPGAVIAAHSLCGIFLPLLADLCKPARLVFVAAVIPEPGLSVRDQFNASHDMFSTAWIEAGPRWFDPSAQASLAREFLFHDCDEETLAWALGTMDLMDPSGLSTEPSPMTRWPDVPAGVIVARGDRTLSPDWIGRTARRVLGVEPLEVDAGHCPHMSRPAQVANLLAELAAGRAD